MTTELLTTFRMYPSTKATNALKALASKIAVGEIAVNDDPKELIMMMKEKGIDYWSSSPIHKLVD